MQGSGIRWLVRVGGATILLAAVGLLADPASAPALYGGDVFANPLALANRKGTLDGASAGAEMMFEKETERRGSGKAAVVLTVLLYGQGLLGVAAVGAVLMKDRDDAARPPVVAALLPVQPTS